MRELCETDKEWLKGIIGDKDYTQEVIKWIEQGKFKFKGEEE